MTDQQQSDVAAALESKEDYASFTFVLDHLYIAKHGEEGGPTVSKVILSSETAVESLLAQLGYYGMMDVLREPGTLAVIASAEEKATVFFLKVSDLQTNILVDNSLAGEALLMNPAVNPNGTLMGAHALLVDLASTVMKASREEGHAGRRILAYRPD